MKKINKNIILFVGNVPEKYIKAVEETGEKLKCNFRIAIITDAKTKIIFSPKLRKRISYLIKCGDRNKDIRKKIASFKYQIVAVYFVYEKYADIYCDVLKVVKLSNNPTIESIKKSIDKLQMRKAFYRYDKSITPKFIQVKNKNSADLISKKIGFPCFLKPAHLSRSKLITISNNMEELERNLDKIFNEINRVYKKEKRKFKPIIVAEERVKGEMYTVDVYIDRKQKIYFTPFIYQITAKDLGINDFHIYARISPAGLSNREIKKAKLTVKKGVFSLGLKNAIGHFELMKTDKEWKIIEVGPRIGAYRDEILKISYDIQHVENYIRLKLNQCPIVKDKLLFYSVFLEFFSQEKGYLKSVKGIRKIKKLKSFFSLSARKKKNVLLGLARDGHSYVLKVTLRNKNKKDFYSDLETVKNIIKIKIDKKKPRI